MEKKRGKSKSSLVRNNNDEETKDEASPVSKSPRDLSPADRKPLFSDVWHRTTS